ncbi:hypothetical protein KSB_55370 [Ktedonobacter robiniae]|uniref:DUF192 domain-containing protein n=1 Tax=Ktedonobacter robiniae TaxID=2778365 RepID=A0ABQ3UWV7_9CHLR|nr:hypothetical protein KSB_55370 [Ktedonobacter robiniae]
MPGRRLAQATARASDNNDFSDDILVLVHHFPSHLFLMTTRWPLVAVSQDRDSGHGVVNLPQIAFGKLDLDRADVLWSTWMGENGCQEQP